MRIAFESEALRDICLKADIANQHLGDKIAASLFAALSDLDAAENAADLFMAEIVEANEDPCERMRIQIGQTCRLEFTSNHNRHNGPNAERVVWSQVKRVKIMGISTDAK